MTTPAEIFSHSTYHTGRPALVDHRTPMRISRFVAAAVLILLLTGPAAAEHAGTSDKTFAPIEYGYPDQSIFVATQNEKGRPGSPMRHLAEVLMERTGIPWQAKPYPAKRLFENLRKGTTDFSILVRASSLKDDCLFSKHPVYSTTLNVYYIGDKPAVTSKQDFPGKRVITICGYSYAGLLKFISDPANQVTNEVAGTHKAAFKMLANNRAEYLLDYASAADDILAAGPIKNIKSNPISRLDIFLVLSGSYPDAEELMLRLEGIVKTLDVNAILKRK